MSSEVRTAIAAAATITDKTKITPYFRQVTNLGHGFVRRGPRSRDDSGFGWIDIYEVVIPLSQDLETTEKFIEDIEEQLLSNLNAVMVVQTMTPSELVFDTGSVPGVIVAGAVPV